MTQTLAILLDAYRELNARKLFWITLAISGIVIVFYASMGFDDKGMFFFFGLMHTDSEWLRVGTPLAALLYRSIFSTIIVSLWLAWVATILALVSTASIFPDLLGSGSIDLVLSKPIGRIRLFFTKYLASMLFVVLQVSVFCLGVFICIGWRIGEWNWKIFAAIPLVTVFFSYLFCVCVFMGVMTRSTLAALLLTLVFWFTLFGGNTTEGLLLQNRISTEMQLKRVQNRVEQLESRLSQLPPESQPDQTSPARDRIKFELESERTTRDSLRSAHEKIDRWHAISWWVQLPLPKTDETIGLLPRWLKKKNDVSFLDLLAGNIEADDQGNPRARDGNRDREVARRMESEAESFSVWYVLGTSLVFEIVVLGAACWVFARRDF